jgi:predicted O-methyltransferase YrrM
MATDPVMRIDRPFEPELLRDVQSIIQNFLRYRADLITGPQRVLELGSGWSTPWFASMPNVTVTSVEHHQDWANEVSRVIRAERMDNTLYLVSPEEFAETVDGMPKNHYDLALVDCVDESRIPCLEPCMRRLKPDGWLVVDDSHWEMFDGLPDRMKAMGYLSTMIQGNHRRKTGEVKFHQTHIFFKE